MALVNAASYISITAQSTEKPAPFGSSLKRPAGETKGDTKEQAREKSVGENLRQPEEIVRIDTSLVNLDVVVKDAEGPTTSPGSRGMTL
jgi:hypothetical protein